MYIHSGGHQRCALRQGSLCQRFTAATLLSLHGVAVLLSKKLQAQNTLHQGSSFLVFGAGCAE